MTADSTSVIQKACQTPVGPSWRQSSHASGMMKMTYRQREMTSEAAPLPRPSSAPEEVVDTADTTKPRQMMRRAVWPMAMVSGLEVNRPSQRACNGQAEQGANGHDPGAQAQCQVVELGHTAMLPGTVVVATSGRIPCTMPLAGR